MTASGWFTVTASDWFTLTASDWLTLTASDWFTVTASDWLTPTASGWFKLTAASDWFTLTGRRSREPGTEIGHVGRRRSFTPSLSQSSAGTQCLSHNSRQLGSVQQTLQKFVSRCTMRLHRSRSVTVTLVQEKLVGSLALCPRIIWRAV